MIPSHTSLALELIDRVLKSGWNTRLEAWPAVIPAVIDNGYTLSRREIERMRHDPRAIDPQPRDITP